MMSKVKGDSYSYAIARRSSEVSKQELFLMGVNRLPPVSGLSITPRKSRRAQMSCCADRRELRSRV